MTQIQECQKIHILLLLYPDLRSLPEDQRINLQKHLQACHDCQNFLALEKLLKAKLKSYLDSLPVPKEYEENVNNFIQSQFGSDIHSLQTVGPEGLPTEGPQGLETQDVKRTEDLHSTQTTEISPTRSPEDKAKTVPSPDATRKASTLGRDTMGKRSSKLELAKELISTRRTTHPSAEKKKIKSLPVKEWDRYEFVAFLGRGGMGQVFKAYDPYLDRYVALKFIFSENPENMKRFLHEAQSQARIDHPNVCKVYEVGEVENKLYIAMQYIKGDTFDRAAKKMTLEQKLITFKHVCEALHTAHMQGLIHRDIKPANIMVEFLESQGWIPYVMDFGLAKDLDTPGMTQHGMVMGSPSYMPPEQARGEIDKLDRRSDVYSLGATLYELLVGRPPFIGKTAIEVVMKVVNEEPTPLRKLDANIPVDLETIVMKCLEKEPHRRYESAKALAEDIERYLNGEPILARKASIIYRLSKKVKKHKTLVAVTSIAATLLIILGINLGMTKYQARVRTRLAAQLGQSLESIVNFVRMNQLLPPHNVLEDKKEVLKKIDTVKTMAEKVGDIGRGPGQYAVGRGYLSIYHFFDALHALKSAWDTYAYREPAVAFALGRAYGEIYLHELDKAERIDNPTIRQARIRDIKKRFLVPARQYLSQALGKGTVEHLFESPALAKAILAFYQQQYDAALKLSQEASRERQYLYEGKKLEGNVFITRGYELRDKGEYKDSENMFQKAIQAFKEAVNIARSDDMAYEGLCRAYLGYLTILSDQGKEFSTLMSELINACQQASRINPKNVSAYNKQAYAYLRKAYFLIERQQNPMPSIQKALELSKKSVSIKPNDEGFHLVGTSHWMLALAQLYSGNNPKDELDMAIKAFENAIKLDKNRVDSYLNLGNVYGLLTEGMVSMGQDPTQVAEKAFMYYQKAIDLQPNLPEAYVNYGRTLDYLAIYRFHHGKKPFDLFKKARTMYMESLKRNPNYPVALDELSLNYYSEMQAKINYGIPPEENVKQADKILSRLFKMNPDYPYAYNTRTGLFAWLMMWELEHGKDITPIYQKIKKLTASARKRFPGNPLIPYHEGVGALVYGEYLVLNDKNPIPDLRRARKIFEKYKEFEPGEPETYLMLCTSYAIEGKWRIKQNQSPIRTLRRGIKEIKTGLEINPESVDHMACQVELLLHEVEWKLKMKQNPVKLIENVEKILKEGKNINNENLPLALAELRFLKLQILAEQSEKSKKRIASNGIKAVKHLFSFHPEHPLGYAFQAYFQYILGHKENAQNVFEKALSMNPLLQNEFPDLHTWLQEQKENKNEEV